MRLYEFAGIPDNQKLVGLAQLLSGRADNTNAKKEISTDTFIKLARNLGVQVTPDTIGDMIAKPPLSNVFEPYSPNEGVVKFKGNDEEAPMMSYNQAEEIVDTNAKRAMKNA